MKATDKSRSNFGSDRNFARKGSTLASSVISAGSGKQSSMKKNKIEGNRPQRLSLLKHTLVRQGTKPEVLEDIADGENSDESPLIPEPGHANFVGDVASDCASLGDISPKRREDLRVGKEEEK